MPIINKVVDTLEDISYDPVDLLLTDADETLFYHNSSQPYDDTIPFIERLNPKQLVLVSANPDKRITEQRALCIGADHVVSPQIATWVKYRLFKRALDVAYSSNKDIISSAVVLGNRWFMDVAVGRFVLNSYGIHNNQGVVVRRPESTATERFDQFFTFPIELAGSLVLRKLGYDQYIRPREDSRYI